MLATRLGASDEQAGLRSAEQLVAAEGDQVGAIAHAVAYRWLTRQHRTCLRREGVSGEEIEAEPTRSRSSMRGTPNAGPAPRDRPVAARSVKPSIRKFDGCTRRIAAVRSPRSPPRSRRRACGSWCRPRAAARPTLRHDVGDAEAAADFHQLAARDDDLATAGERGQYQYQSRRRVVVDDDAASAPVSRREQGLGVGMSREPRWPVCRSYFEIAVAGADALHGRQRVARERRPPEVRVDHDPGGVDHRPGATSRRCCQPGGQSLDQQRAGELARARLRLSRANSVRKRGDFGVESLTHPSRAVSSRQRLHLVQLQQVIDRRDDARPGHVAMLPLRPAGPFPRVDRSSPHRGFDGRCAHDRHCQDDRPRRAPAALPDYAAAGALLALRRAARSSRRRRNSRPSTPTLHTALFGRGDLPFSVTLLFPRSTAPTTSARWTGPAVGRVPRGRAAATSSAHRARFFPRDAARMRDLFVLVGDLPPAARC